MDDRERRHGCRITVTIHLETTMTRLLAALAPLLLGLATVYLR
jgi:hypothetical protein